MNTAKMYTVARGNSATYSSIWCNGASVGSISHEKQGTESTHPYHYVAVLHDSANQDGKSQSGHDLADTMNRLLDGAPWLYIWPNNPKEI